MKTWKTLHRWIAEHVVQTENYSILLTIEMVVWCHKIKCTAIRKQEHVQLLYFIETIYRNITQNNCLAFWQCHNDDYYSIYLKYYKFFFSELKPFIHIERLKIDPPFRASPSFGWARRGWYLHNMNIPEFSQGACGVSSEKST